MSVRTCLVQDGIEEVPKDEFQSYVARIRKTESSSYHIIIPKPIIRKLGLNYGDALEVAIRLADESIIKEHMGVYGRDRSKYGGINYIDCPKCGIRGRIYLHYARNCRYIIIYHLMRRTCFIGRADKIQSPLKEVIAKMMEIKENMKEE